MELYKFSKFHCLHNPDDDVGRAYYASLVPVGTYPHSPETRVPCSRRVSRGKGNARHGRPEPETLGGRGKKNKR